MPLESFVYVWLGREIFDLVPTKVDMPHSAVVERLRQSCTTSSGVVENAGVDLATTWLWRRLPKAVEESLAGGITAWRWNSGWRILLVMTTLNDKTIPYWKISRENSHEISREISREISPQNLIWPFSSIIIKFRYFLSPLLNKRFLKSHPPIFLYKLA